MTKECVPSLWRRIEIIKTSDRLNPSYLEDEKVSVESKRLYIGTRSQWSIKPKNLTAIKMEGEETTPSSISIKISTTEMTVNLIHLLTEETGWTKFFKRLNTFVNHSKVHLELPKPAAKSVASPRKRSHNARDPPAGAFFETTGNMRFSPSRKPRRQQQRSMTSPLPAGHRGRTFSRKAPRLTLSKPTLPWDEDENDDSLVVPPSPEKKVRGVASLFVKSTTHNQKDDQVLVETDDEDALFDNADSEKPRGKFLDESDGEESNTVTAKHLTTPPGTTTTPLRRQRRVSPASRTQEKVSSNESKLEGTSKPKKGPHTISSFFAKQATVSPVVASFDPSKRAFVAKTPDRPPTIAKKSGEWIESSNAGLTSPIRKRKHDLFGTPLTETPVKDLQDDPIQEFTPTRHNPMDILKQAVDDPIQMRFGSLAKRAPTTGLLARKRKRVLEKAKSSTPPRRLSLDVPKKPEEPTAIVQRNPWRGLQNLGNTCYLNSSLQMLLTLVSTAHGRKNWWESLRGKGGNLTTRLLDIVDQLVLPPSPFAVNPSQLKIAVDAITDKFIGYNQHDAHEFLSDLIDFVHEELENERQGSLDKVDGIDASVAGTIPNGVSEKESSSSQVPKHKTERAEMPPLPTDDFRLTLEVCLRCESCGYSRTKEEIYRHLSLDIKSDDGNEKALIAAGLSQFFQPQSLEIRCEKCSEGTHATQSLRVLSSPKYLLLHLKRFIFVERPIPTGSENAPPNSPSSRPEMEYIFKKNKAQVDLAGKLNLEPFCVDPISQSYHLRSIVHHIGARPSSGHYMADAVRPYRAPPVTTSQSDDASAAGDDSSPKPPPTDEEDKPAEKPPPEEEWITFDDKNSCKTTIEKIQANKFKQQTAYMLLYALES